MLSTSSMRPPCLPCPLALVLGSATLRTRILTYIREYACVRACMICPHICMHAEDQPLRGTVWESEGLYPTTLFLHPNLAPIHQPTLSFENRQ